MGLPRRDASWHSAIIAGLVATYKAPTYIEIGVFEGDTLARVAPFCKHAHGVDVDFSNLKLAPHKAELWEMPSDVFFEAYNGPKADVIFIDGDHRYAAVSRDVAHALLILAEGGTLILHDTWPEYAEDLDPRVCGTAWRAAEDLRRDPRLAVWTHQRFPGLTFVNRFHAPPICIREEAE